MPFDVRFEIFWFRNDQGAEVAEEELTAIPEGNPVLANQIRAAIGKLQNGLLHKYPFTQDIGDGLHEVRLVASGVRILYAYVGTSRLIIMRTFVKKRDEIPPGERARALNRLKDYQQRQQGKRR